MLLVQRNLSSILDQHPELLDVNPQAELVCRVVLANLQIALGEENLASSAHEPDGQKYAPRRTLCQGDS